MYNKRFTVPFASLNAGTDISVPDILMPQTKTDARGRVRNIKWYPSEMQIINDTGDLIEINLFHDLAEYQDYGTNPDNHAFIRLPDGYIMQDENGFASIYQILVRGVSGGSATSDLIIEMLNYIPRR